MINIKQTRNEHYISVVNDLLVEMREGSIPWKKPWFNKLPTNLVTKKSYTGLNILNLTMIAKKMGYHSHYWVTKIQAENLGGRIKEDQLKFPHFIIMAKWQSKQWRDDKGDEHVNCWLMIKSYPVYNIEQTINLRVPSDSNNYSLFGIESHADYVVNKYQNPPRIIYDNDRAFYRPFDDLIGIPDLNQFISSEEYYSTLFHELVHSTGHRLRLDRPSFRNTILNKDELYAKEELVAEIGSAFLSSYCGFFSQTKKNSAAYLNSWLKDLEQDNTLMFRLASNAQQAFNFILGELEEKYEEPTLFDEQYKDIEWSKLSQNKWD